MSVTLRFLSWQLVRRRAGDSLEQKVCWEKLSLSPKKCVFESLERLNIISAARLALVWLNTGFAILSEHSLSNPAS